MTGEGNQKVEEEEEEFVKLIYHCENQFLDPETKQPRSLELDVTNDIIFADDLDVNGEPPRSIIIQQVMDREKTSVSPFLPSGYQELANSHFVLIPYKYASAIIDVLEIGMNYSISISPQYLDICGRGVDTIDIDKKMQIF